MLKRSIKCAQCGASKETSDSAMVVLCDFCGAYIAIASEQIWAPETIAERTREAMRRALNPTATEARWQSLAGLMQAAKQAGDRQGWRLAAEEFFALYPLLDSTIVPAGMREGPRLVDWMRGAAGVAEICAFDPELLALDADCSRIISGLFTGADAWELAQAYLKARMVYDGKLYSHPDYPEGLDRLDPEKSARDNLRTILQGQGLMIPEEIMRRIRTELLGEQELSAASTCENCGARVDEQAISEGRCPFCGGRMAIQRGDSQVQAMLGSFAAMEAAIADETTLALTAINLALAPLFSGGAAPPIEVMTSYLREAWKERDPRLLLSAIESLRPMAASYPELGPLFDELCGWLRRGAA